MVDDGEFNNLTVNNVLTIGADTNLYRGAADIIATDDDLKIKGDWKGIKLYNAADTEIGRIQGSPTAYHLNFRTIQAGGNFQWFDTNSNLRMTLTNAGQLQLPVTGSSGGIVTGSGASIEHNSPHIDLDDLQFPTPYKDLNSLGYGNLLFKNTTAPDPPNREYPDNGIYTSLFLAMVEDPSEPQGHKYYEQ